jgi:hypothetical protein
MASSAFSGGDVEGTVVSVGTNAVHIARPAGMDFFDGSRPSRPDRAVIVRVRN